MDLRGLRVVVAGAGAVGSAVALTLQRRGAAVVLSDTADAPLNASSVAAGMLAPAMEAVLDPLSRSHFGLLKQARNRWPPFLDGITDEGARPEQCGVLWIAAEPSQADVLERLGELGAPAEQLSGARAEAMSQDLKAPAGGVFTGEDWRLDPRATLQAMERAFLALGGERRHAGLAAFAPGGALFQDGERLATDAVVLATGLAPRDLAEPLPELDCLEPIKGQILRFHGASPRSGPCVRAPGIYVAPSTGAVVAGATMEPGLDDLQVDPAAVARRQSLASGLFPPLAALEPAPAAGVRSSTPDGLPMVGPSSRSGLFLAVGARRNGWLLAPLMAEVLADRIAGAAPGGWAERLDPARFGLSQPG